MVKFLPPENPVHQTSASLQARLRKAQDEQIDCEFPSFLHLWNRVNADLRTAIVGDPNWATMPVRQLAEVPFKVLVERITPQVVAAGLPLQAQQDTASAFGRRIHLLLAFGNPDAIILAIEEKVFEIASKFPASARDIECGKNPGDVIDPYLLAAAQHLLFNGSFEKTVDASVSHKVFMMLEDLIGHLHEDVIGVMRGNVRVPEPRGETQEGIHYLQNPFPGADIVQPPLAEGGVMRFHQVKNKTGSAKGGDGKRLGDQLQRLKDVYGGEIFYDALVGTTLRGHRSRAGVMAAAPSAVVLVGRAAFKELTYHVIGPELLLRVYQEAFQVAARRAGYDYETVVSAIVHAFQEKAEAEGTNYLEGVLHDVIDGDAAQQDSRLQR